MQPNIAMKSAGYVAWILLCKRCKFGGQFQRYRIFPRGLLFLAHPVDFIAPLPRWLSAKLAKIITKTLIINREKTIRNKINNESSETTERHVWGVTPEHYKTFHPKTKIIDGLKKVLQLIWDQLPQDSINKAMLRFTKRQWACVKGGIGIISLRDRDVPTESCVDFRC